jgi:hypothetical protein
VTYLQKAVTTGISRSCLFYKNSFHQATHCRYISLKAKYLDLLKNVPDKNQFLYLARQVYPEDSQSLYKFYLEATERPHGYLILDFAQNTDDRLRFRTNIFPAEYPPIVYAPINNVASKIELEADQVKFPPTGSVKKGKTKIT